MVTVTARTRPAPPKALDTARQAARLAELFHALSDPTRIRIVAALRQGEECVCNLTGLLDAQQSRLSFHLKTLKEAGLVVDRREGRWIHYSLVPETFEEIRLALEELSKVARSSAAACCRR